MSEQAWKDFELKGRKYRISKMNGEEGTEMLLRLAQALAPGLAAMFGGGQNKEDLLKAAPQLLVGALSMGASDGKQLIKDLLKNVQVAEHGSQTASDLMKTYFVGRFAEPLALAKEVLTYNYDNFFEEVVSLLGLREITQKPSLKSRKA